MEYNEPQVQWTEEQWNLVQQTVRDEARKVRVAASCLPLHGPLPPDAQSVPLQDVAPEDTGEPSFWGELQKQVEVQHAQFKAQRARRGAKVDPGQIIDAFFQSIKDLKGPGYSASRQRGEPEQRLLVDDHNTRPLTTISVNVYLRRAQVAQPDLSSALIMFRRAANIIARVEDRIVFGGQPKRDPEPEQLNVKPAIFNVTGGESFKGLIDSGYTLSTAKIGRENSGEALVRVVATGMTRLENFGHLAPFALVLGSQLFIDVHTPDTSSLVLPADRIKPLLDGPLLRTSTIDPNQGVLISLASDLVDLVVASDISVQFIQVTMEPRYVYRVSQRFTVRVKQPEAIVALRPDTPGEEGGGEKGDDSKENDGGGGGRGPRKTASKKI